MEHGHTGALNEENVREWDRELNDSGALPSRRAHDSLRIAEAHATLANLPDFMAEGLELKGW